MKLVPLLIESTGDKNGNSILFSRYLYRVQRIRRISDWVKIFNVKKSSFSMCQHCVCRLSLLPLCLGLPRLEQGRYSFLQLGRLPGEFSRKSQKKKAKTPCKCRHNLAASDKDTVSHTSLGVQIYQFYYCTFVGFHLHGIVSRHSSDQMCIVLSSPSLCTY